MKTQASRYKEFWATIQGNDLFVNKYKDNAQGPPETRVMHSLIGTFIKKAPNETGPDKTELWPVKVIFPPGVKYRVLYFKTENMQKEWYQKLKSIVGQNDILEYYVIQRDLGKGQFGVVKLAHHKKTGNSVAIKVVEKKNLKPIDVQQHRQETQVLRMCQHPNIVELVDVFENSEYYYIV